MLEFNELTPRLLYPLMQAGELPNFQKLFSSSEVYTTDAGESGYELNPWVQWVTVHTGKTFAEHGVFLLGEGHERNDLDTIAAKVERAGFKSWQCGSMNVPLTQNNGSYGLPDPWAPRETVAHPSPLNSYHQFVQSQVQEHTNPNAANKLEELMSFARFMWTHGLTITSCFKTLEQLTSETFAKNRTGRALLLDTFQFDVFQKVFKRIEPLFASFFSNSVAHMQHCYWRDYQPELFQSQNSYESANANAIRSAYKANDELVGRALKFGDDVTIVFCTALSQEPAVNWEDSGGKRFYRPYDLEEFCNFAGLDQWVSIEPVMAEEFWISFKDTEAAELGENQVKQIFSGNQRAFKTSVIDNRLYTGCSIIDLLPDNAEIENRATGRSLPIGSLLYCSDTVKSGMHNPEGMFWVRRPNGKHLVHENPIPLTAVAPYLEGLLGVGNNRLALSAG